jgi:hypothetical protein
MLLTVADERGNPVATGAQRSEACDIPELTVHGPPRVGRLLGASAIFFFFFFRWVGRSFHAPHLPRRPVLFCSERRTTRAAAGECQYTALSSA